MEILIYLAKANACFAVFVIGFVLLFRRESLLRFNRAYLMLAPVLAALLPLIQWPAAAQIGLLPVFELAPVIVTETANQTSVSLATTDWILIGWLAVAAGLIGLLGWKLLRLVRVVRTGKRIPAGAAVRLSGQADLPTFSFFRFIHLEPFDDADADRAVLEHELTHVRQWHTVDVLLYEVFRAVWWFNPLVWVAAKELRLVHEYEADRAASKTHPDYSQLLVGQALGVPRLDLVHTFRFSNNLKQRLTMLQKTSSVVARFKLAIVLPLLAVSIALAAWLPASESPATATVTGEPVYDKVDQMPMFRDGMPGLINYMGNQVKYPKAASEKGIEGRVLVEFVVDSKGKVINAVIKEGLESSIDKEALRVVSTMPDWTPGQKDGKAVSVKMVLPIQFKLGMDDGNKGDKC